MPIVVSPCNCVSAFSLIECRGREAAQPTYGLERLQMCGDLFGSLQATAEFGSLLEHLANLPGAEVQLFGQGNLFIPLKSPARRTNGNTGIPAETGRPLNGQGRSGAWASGVHIGLVILGDGIQQRAGFRIVSVRVDRHCRRRLCIVVNDRCVFHYRHPSSPNWGGWLAVYGRNTCVHYYVRDQRAQ